ncbi:MAG: peptide chain release factor N(5)-glutamine methyltransferase [bacterium]|nr:peptide chain release factor N(5)-glutamine methyltransferase [bacterium]
MPRRQQTSNIETVLRQAGLDFCESRDLLVHVLRKPLSFLIAYPDTILTPVQLQKFRGLVVKRRHGVPFAYLTGHQGFYGLDFMVTKDVLIPRPETEQLIDWVLAHTDRKAPSIIIDVGTGSGCIAVTLAKYLPTAKIIASDVSEKALEVARKNTRTHKVSTRIQFRHGSLLSVLKPNELPDLVVANLPYLAKPQLKNVPHEPKLALHGGTRGLELVEKIVAQVAERNIPKAILEIDPAQERWLTGIGDRLTGYHYEFLSDLAGRTRFFVLKNR